MVVGVYNEALRLYGGSNYTQYMNTAVAGHTPNANFVVTFWFKLDTSVSGETGDVNYVEIKDGTTTLFKFYYHDSANDFKVDYGGSLHATITTNVLDDGKMHFIRVSDTYVYVDDNEYGGVQHNISGTIDTIYVGDSAMDAGQSATIDELAIYEDSYTEYTIEDTYWKKYYYFQHGETPVDFNMPVLLETNLTSTSLLSGNYLIRIEAGNPLIYIEDLTKAKNDLTVKPELNEWTIVLGNNLLQDARHGETTDIEKAQAHKYLFALHQKTANGMAVFAAVDAEEDVSITETTKFYTALTFQKSDKLVVGFQHWPVWYYFREGGDADNLQGAMRSRGPDVFFSGAALTSGNYPQYDFYSMEYGSYLIIIGSEIGEYILKIGDGDDDDRHYNETLASSPRVARPFNYRFGTLTDDPVKMRVTTTWVSGYPVIDYIGIVPLSNGLHFPLDFIQQLLARNG